MSLIKCPPPLPRSSKGSLWRQSCPFPQSSFTFSRIDQQTWSPDKTKLILLSKTLVNKPSSRFSNGAPMKRDAHFQNLPFTYASGSPVREPSLQVSLAELSLIRHSKLPVNEPHSRFPNGAPTDGDVRFKSQCFVHSLVSLRVPSYGELPWNRGKIYGHHPRSLT